MNPYESPTARAESTEDDPAARPLWSRWLQFAALGAGAAFLVWLWVIAREPSVLLTGFSVWIAAPFLGLWLAALFFQSRPAVVVLGLALVATVAVGVWGFQQVYADAQGGLILLFLPGYQLIGVGIAVLLAGAMNLFARRQA